MSFLEEYGKFMREEFKDYPDDAFEVAMFELYARTMPVTIGSVQAQKFKEIRAKYPQFWPWEAKYDSIPKSVHDAYYEEWCEIFGWKSFDYVNSGKGIESVMDGVITYKPIESQEEFAKILSDFDSRKCEQEKQEKDRQKKERHLWNKYYSKYGLKYRG